MINTSDISQILSNKLGEKLNKNRDERDVLNYGLFVIIHTAISIIITIIIGIMTKTLYEIIVITIVSALFKRYSGGVHASSPERCTAIGVLISLVLAMICKYKMSEFNLFKHIIFIITSFAITYFILYKKCPVGSKNKPLKKESTRKLLRKKAFILTSLLLVIELILLLVYLNKDLIILKNINMSILLGMLLQVFVLTKAGKIFIEKLDEALKMVL